MCGRLSLAVDPTTLQERFDARPPPALEPRYNIAPGRRLATIRSDDPDRIDLLEWGLIPQWADDPGSAHINARAETITEKPSFREPYEERRCLVLADGYYDWADERGRGKQPYRFTRVDGAPFAMAGLWERWEGNGEVRETVAILTTEPNGVVEPIHHRMPVILDPTEESRWLDPPGMDALSDLLDPYPADELRAYPVPDAVNDPANDSPTVIEEIDPPTQRGLDDFT